MNNEDFISGQAAKIVWASGSVVEYNISGVWYEVNDENTLNIFNTDYKFRIKPKTININGIEVPATFKPKVGEKYWCFSTETVLGYGWNVYESEDADRRFMNMGAWKSEEEIKKVIDALRSVFKGNI